ncbi:Ankyrin-like protein [Globisporangium polare]
MGPNDAASMAALYVRNRRQRTSKYGEIPLSAGEIEYLSCKDEAVRRRQRLLEVRNHEKRVAQLVTQRYRDNLRRLHAHKLRGAQLAHQQQQEALLGELHRRYQQSLQNVGSAHRQAREMLAELVEDAHVEQSKWAYNEARVTKARSGEASRLHGEEKEGEVARRKEVEDNLQRLKETSMKQRAQASIRARREQELQIELARRREEVVRFRRQVVKEEVFAMSRPRVKDVDAYQFTRLHCVSAPPVPTTALKPRAEVKVIRHNIAHPSAVNGIDEAKKYRDEMDARREQERSLREQNVEKADQRGDHALEQVKSKQDGEKAIEWLQQIDKAQRIH